jgi:outer membrane murein-binding lipoprotein Lpp
MKMKNNERGSMLIASVIVTMLLLAGAVQYVNWVNQMTKSNVHRIATQKALINADSGVQAALQYLRTAKAAELVPGVPMQLISISEGTTFYLTLTRQVRSTTA